MRRKLLLLVPLGLIACGGSDSPKFAQIVLTSGGASPATVVVPSGASVHFVNHDTADHQIASASCSELASPKMAAGAEFDATIGAGPKSCSFNDGLNPSSTAFQGTVSVQAPGTSGGGGGY